MLLLAAVSCRKDVAKNPGAVATPYTLKVPERFPQPALPDFNPLTREGVTLGNNLYHDDILSTNGLACASCHHPSRSFSSPLFVSKTGEKTSIPPHINLAWNPEYNWNGSAPVLDLLCLADFGPDFFNTDMDLLVKKLKAHPHYPRMFSEAFGVNDVARLSHDELQLKIVYAISQFVRTMTSSDSKFDRWLRHEVVFTPEELAGFEIFYSERGDCFHCHGYPLMTSNKFTNNGLDANPSGPDLGRFRVTGLPGDKAKFSIPTLRNIELTSPYMHDGRYLTLEEVIEFYDHGVQFTSPNLDPLMTKAMKRYGLNLTTADKQNLVVFLKTLTDTVFLNNPDYAKPQ
jgi:cytochrome c peroxidase